MARLPKLALRRKKRKRRSASTKMRLLKSEQSGNARRKRRRGKSRQQMRTMTDKLSALDENVFFFQSYQSGVLEYGAFRGGSVL
jgi:hypothetical protein